jgi:hypothetical protein
MTKNWTITTLYGKTYVWIQAEQTGQWRLIRVGWGDEELV